MAIPFDLASAADLYDPAIQKMWIKSGTEDTEMYKQLCHVESSVTDYNLKDSSLSGLGAAARITENASVVFESPVQGLRSLMALVKSFLIYGERCNANA